MVGVHWGVVADNSQLSALEQELVLLQGRLTGTHHNVSDVVVGSELQLTLPTMVTAIHLLGEVLHPTICGDRRGLIELFALLCQTYFALPLRWLIRSVWRWLRGVVTVVLCRWSV